MTFVVIAHNIRSAHNVGSIFRSCEGFGAQHLYLTGYTPYPATFNDSRLPHISQNMSLKINKTALGAEKLVAFTHIEDANVLLHELKSTGYYLVALEQANNSTPIHNLTLADTGNNIALILGEEIHGVSKEILNISDLITEIPMHGKKESFNVAVAAGVAMYALCNIPKIHDTITQTSEK